MVGSIPFLGRLGRIHEIDLPTKTVYIVLWRKVRKGDTVSFGDKLQTVDRLILGGNEVDEAKRGCIVGIKISTFNLEKMDPYVLVQLHAR